MLWLSLLIPIAFILVLLFGFGLVAAMLKGVGGEYYKKITATNTL
jgi:hypothetical protein